MNFQNIEDNKKIMSNFANASSPRLRCILPLDSFHTNKPSTYGTPFSRMSERYSLDPKYSSPTFNKNTATNMTLVNPFHKLPTKFARKERWYHKIFGFFKMRKLSMYEKSLRRQKSKFVKNASMNSKFIRKVGKLKTFEIQHSQSDIKKRKNFLLVIYMVKKFIQIIKTYTFVKRIFRLKAYHFNIIGDISSFYQRGSEFGEKFFGNLTNRPSQNYVLNKIFRYHIHSTLKFFRTSRLKICE